jgi:hypothetical protein
MDYQKIQDWFERIGAIHYRVKDSKNKRVLGRTLSNPSQVFEHFQDSVSLLSDGKYIIESSDNAQNSRGQSYHSFTIGETENEMNIIDIESIKKAAYMEALTAMKTEALEKSVEVLKLEVKGLKDIQEKIVNTLREHFNESDTKSVTESMADSIGEAAELYETAKSSSFFKS